MSTIDNTETQKHQSTPIETSRETLAQVVELRTRLGSMVNKTYELKRQCNKMEDENKYLQDYVGNLMTADILIKK